MAVSSPQTNAPAPSLSLRWKEKSEPMMLSPMRPSLLGGLHGDLESADGQRILGPHVEVADGRADGVGADGHALEHGVRVALQHRAVHERARVALVAVADEVLLTPSGGLLAAANFHFSPVGKPAPPRPRRPEARISSMTCSGRHAGEDLVEGLVAVGLQVVLDLLRIDDAHVPQDQLLLAARRTRRTRWGLSSVRTIHFSMGSPPRMCLVDDLVDHGRRDLAVGDLAPGPVQPHVDLHQRVHGAEPLAAGAGDRGAPPRRSRPRADG